MTNLSAKDLRIGNWFKYSGIGAVDNDYCYVSELKENQPVTGLTPIPLTRKILRQYGSLRVDFSELSPDVYIPYGFPVSICFLWSVDHLCLSYFDGDKYIDLQARVFYLHELQNIYKEFAFKELPINLKQLQQA